MSDLHNETEVVSKESAQIRSFNPSEHIMQIKSEHGTRDYLPVQWRLVWFRSTCPHGSIETEMLHLDLDRDTEEETLVWNAERRRNEKIAKHAKGFVIFRAVVKDGQGGIATGTKSEKAASFPDFIEKAETGAIGRALAALGYGTQFTGDEWDEAHRIVDSPVDRQSALAPKNGNNASKEVGKPLASNGPAHLTSEQEAESPVSEQQLSSIRKLCEHLSKPEPENITSLTFLSARKVIQQLTTEYKEARQQNKAS
jgi:hypothetical protein